MSKWIYIALGSAAAMIGIPFLVSAKKEVEALNSLKIGFSSFDLPMISWTAAAVDISLSLVNSGNIPLVIKSVDLEIVHKNNRMGVIGKSDQIVVPANGSKVVKLKSIINSQSGLALLLKIGAETVAGKKGQSYPIQLLGKVNYVTNTFGNEVKYPINVTFDLADFLPKIKAAFESLKKIF